MNLVAAIDYTASNGPTEEPRSLHYFGNKPNAYETALMKVGGVLEEYANDKSFPVFGFGGIPRHLKLVTVSHCFAVNGNKDSPFIRGIETVVKTYKDTLHKIALGGPTLFVPLLTEFFKYV